MFRQLIFIIILLNILPLSTCYAGRRIYQCDGVQGRSYQDTPCATDAHQRRILLPFPSALSQRPSQKAGRDDKRQNDRSIVVLTNNLSAVISDARRDKCSKFSLEVKQLQYHLIGKQALKLVVPKRLALEYALKERNYYCSFFTS